MPTTNQKSLLPWILFTAIVASAVPVLLGLVVITSTWLGRSLLARPQWRWAMPRGTRTGDEAVARRAAISWTLILFVAGIVQIAIEVGSGLPITNPAGFLIRSLAAFLVELTAFVYMQHRSVGATVGTERDRVTTSRAISYETQDSLNEDHCSLDSPDLRVP
jgi:hypothetical protein